MERPDQNPSGIPFVDFFFVHFLKAGTLDDPELARPVATIWAASAPTWACIDESIPRIEGQPSPAG